MGAILFDSSAYLSALRGNSASPKALNEFRPQSALWLSSVVLEELFAGADERGRSAVEHLQREFEKARRILVPNLADWAASGKLLAQLGSRYGYEEIGRARLTNDALIATSAGRAGIKVITENARDFARLSEFCHFEWSIP